MKYNELPKWAQDEVRKIVVEWYNGDEEAATKYINEKNFEVEHDENGENPVVTF